MSNPSLPAGVLRVGCITRIIADASPVGLGAVLAQLKGIIIQHIVTLPKYGHGELNIRRPHITDILRYT